MVTVYIKRDDLSCWVGKGNNMPVRVLKWSPVPVALTKRLNVEEGAQAPCAGHCDSPVAGGSPACGSPALQCVRCASRAPGAPSSPLPCCCGDSVTGVESATGTGRAGVVGSPPGGGQGPVRQPGSGLGGPVSPRSSGMPCRASWMQSYPAGSQEASAGV